MGAIVKHGGDCAVYVTEGALKADIRVPFGVNVVKNPIATIELGAGTGARFGRSCFSGAYMGEYGLYTSNNGEAVRRRKALGIEDFKMLYKVNPEADTYLVQRDVKVVAKSIRVRANCFRNSSLRHELSNI